MRRALGIDVGGTKIAGAVVGEDGEVMRRAELPSPASDVDALGHALVEVARTVLGDDVLAVGVGAAGMVDHEAGIVRSAPNLAWQEFPVTALLTEALGLPCSADNDANVAAWGEWKVGAGNGFRDVLMITVGTGIGGGIVSDGRLFRGAHGFAGEVGHLIVEPDGPLCGCGNRGCWEQMASGRAIDRLAGQAVASNPDSRLAALAGGEAEAIDGSLVSRAAAEGDADALAVLEVVGARLGQGIAGLVNVLDPQAVIVGGGGATSGDLLLEPARAAFADAVEAVDRRPPVPILPAALGGDAGVIGAALLALEATG